jgi:cytochrome b561
MNDQTAEAEANPVPRYSTLMIAIHWSTAILVVVAYILSEGGPTIMAVPALNVPIPRFMDAGLAGIHQVGGNLLLGLAALHALAPEGPILRQS